MLYWVDEQVVVCVRFETYLPSHFGNLFHVARIGVNGSVNHVIMLNGSKLYVSRNAGGSVVE